MGQGCRWARRLVPGTVRGALILMVEAPKYLLTNCVVDAALRVCQSVLVGCEAPKLTSAVPVLPPSSCALRSAEQVR